MTFDDSPVTVSLQSLIDGSADEHLLRAFGPESLGILLVNELDEQYAPMRRKALVDAQKLANLPLQELQEIEVPETSWATGWSRGRETLASGKPDYNKGSFYVNCNFYRRPDLDGPDPETLEKFPDMKESVYPNVWPSPELIPGFESGLKKLISYMLGVTKQVATACDRTLHHQLKGLEQSLQEIVAESDTTKARLLYYYKPEQAQDQWCGEHLDHSCLTALTSALWGPGEISEPRDGPGLYIRSRSGNSVKVHIPEDCIAIQTGSALEVITQGAFKAVPHRVVGDNTHFRSTLAVFCQPRMEERVGDVTFAEYAGNIVKGFSQDRK